MTSMRIYFDGEGVDAADGCSAMDALRSHDPVKAEMLADGSRILTDSRGLPIAPESPAFAGAIYRVVSSRAVERRTESIETTT
jgi:hypothetical protein